MLKNSITSNRYYKIFAILFWMIIWQLLACLINQPLYLPSPLEAFKSLGTLSTQTLFWRSILMTMIRVLVGLALSIALGLVLAILSSVISALEGLLEPLITTMKATPIMSVIILALVWLKADFVPIFVCVLLCFPIIYTNVLEGVKNVDVNLLEMAKLYKVRRRRVFFGITIPSIKPYLFSSIMVCIGFSWKSVVTAEVLSSPKYSMGYNLYSTKLYLDTAGLFAWTIVIVCFSLLLETLVHRVFSRKDIALHRGRLK